jgi:hypothetical protein
MRKSVPAHQHHKKTNNDNVSDGGERSSLAKILQKKTHLNIYLSCSRKSLNIIFIFP